MSDLNLKRPHRGIGGRWPEAVLAAALLLACAFLPHLRLSHDVAWQLWIGRQMAHGVRLYSQIVELNPPLWFWMTVPIVRLAELTGVSGFSVLIGFFVAATALSLGLLAGLIRERPASERFSAYAAFAVLSLALFLREFGQREQYLVLTTIPYLALMLRRVEGRPASPWLAICVAAFAASGFALKPYFLAAPLFLETWLVLTARRNWRPWRPELFVLALCAAAYAVAVVTLTPTYLGSTLRLTALAYGAFNMTPDDIATTELALPAALAALGVATLGRLRSRFAAACLIVGAAFVLSFLVQDKGWFYQGIPASAFILLGIGVELPGLRWRTLKLREKVGYGLLVWAFAVPPFNAALMGFNVYFNRYRNDVAALTADLKPGQSVMTLASRATFTWPMVEERRFLWPSRYYTFWMLPAIVRDRAGGHPRPELAALAKSVQAATLQDMLCHPPVRILVHDARRGVWDRILFQSADFDYLKFFKEDPGIAEFLTHYAPGPRGAWKTFDLVDRNLPPPAGPCRPVY